jgi:hypothetical protein
MTAKAAAAFQRGGVCSGRDGNDWKLVKLTNGSTYSQQLDRFNKVDFEPVTTSALRLGVTLQPNYSGGILEWTTGPGK